MGIRSSTSQCCCEDEMTSRKDTWLCTCHIGDTQKTFVLLCPCFLLFPSVSKDQLIWPLRENMYPIAFPHIYLRKNVPEPTCISTFSHLEVDRLDLSKEESGGAMWVRLTLTELCLALLVMISLSISRDKITTVLTFIGSGGRRLPGTGDVFWLKWV